MKKRVAILLGVGAVLIGLSFGLSSVVAQEPLPGNLILLSKDLAFNVQGQSDGALLGTFKARVDGEWIDLEIAPKLRFAE